MTSVMASVRTPVSPLQAWAGLTDWARQGQWMPLTRVDVVSGDGALGTVLAARTGIGPLGFLDKMVIDIWDPPRRCEVRHLGKVVRGRGIFTVEPADRGGALVTWIEEVEGLPARLTARLTQPLLALALRRFARRLS